MFQKFTDNTKCTEMFCNNNLWKMRYIPGNLSLSVRSWRNFLSSYIWPIVLLINPVSGLFSSSYSSDSSDASDVSFGNDGPRGKATLGVLCILISWHRGRVLNVALGVLYVVFDLGFSYENPFGWGCKCRESICKNNIKSINLREISRAKNHISPEEPYFATFYHYNFHRPGGNFGHLF